jgi:hypothetical protein
MDDKRFDTLTRALAGEGATPRRAFLTAGAGSLALALSALLAREGNDDAAAKGGKHQRRKRRRRRRKHNHGLGSGAPLKNVRVILENHTQSPFDAEGWVYNGNTGQCVKRYQETIQPNLTPTFAPGTSFAYVWIKNKYLIRVQDEDPDEGLPHACIYQGGEFSKACYKWDNDNICRLSGCKELGVGQQWAIPADACRDRIEVQRDGDAGNELVFRVRIIL